jgi:hypothetical protein
VKDIKLRAESCLKGLMYLLTMILFYDFEVRKHLHEKHAVLNHSKIDEFMQYWLESLGAQSILHTLIHTPHRFYRAKYVLFFFFFLVVYKCTIDTIHYIDRLKRGLCACIVAACLELEHHTLLVRQSGKDKYVQKFVEFIIRELDKQERASETMTTTTNNNHHHILTNDLLIDKSSLIKPELEVHDIVDEMIDRIEGLQIDPKLGEEEEHQQQPDIGLEKATGSVVSSGEHWEAIIDDREDWKRNKIADAYLVLIPADYWRNVIAMIWLDRK